MSTASCRHARQAGYTTAYEMITGDSIAGYEFVTGSLGRRLSSPSIAIKRVEGRGSMSGWSRSLRWIDESGFRLLLECHGRRPR